MSYTRDPNIFPEYSRDIFPWLPVLRRATG